MVVIVEIYLSLSHRDILQEKKIGNWNSQLQEEEEGFGLRKNWNVECVQYLCMDVVYNDWTQCISDSNDDYTATWEVMEFYAQEIPPVVGGEQTYTYIYPLL